LKYNNVAIKNNKFKLTELPNLNPDQYDWFISLDFRLPSRKFLAAAKDNVSIQALTKEQLVDILNRCDNSEEEKSMILLKIFG
jgi:hypothetical protein